MSSKLMKRKCVVPSLEDKLAVLDRLKAGTSHTKLAEEYGIGRMTVGDLKKNEKKIPSFTSTMDSMVHVRVFYDASQKISSYFSYLAIYPFHYGWISKGPLYCYPA